mgnify:CR=1 FL=1
MKRIVALLGDYYHDEAPARSALEAAFRAADLAAGAKLAFIGTDALPQALKEGAEAVVLFKENRLDPQAPAPGMWMDEALSDRIAAYVREGGAWLAWHSGLASYPAASRYVRMLRGYFLHHPPEHRVVRYEWDGPLRGENEDRGFSFLDEHYFVQCDEKATEVFLRSRSDDGESVAGWRHGYGRGKVVCLTPAHHREGLLHPAFVRALGQSLSWCLSR